MNQQEILSRFSAEKIITVIDLPEVGDDGVLYLNYICTKYRGTLKMYEVCKAFCWDSSENEWEYLGVYDEYEELLLSKIKRLERCSNKGEWKKVTHGFPPEPTEVCSECGYDVLFEISKLVKGASYTLYPYRPNFCPNCGADMRKEDDE